MTFNPAPFAFALLQAIGIYDKVMGRDGLIVRPAFVSKAVLGRLRTGIRALEAFLRRILILMALEIEHDLVFAEKPEDLSRAKAKMPRIKTYYLMIYRDRNRMGFPDFAQTFVDHTTFESVPEHDRDAVIWPRPLVPIGNWLDCLDHLHAIAKNPLAKARRLAFTLARSRHGILMVPDAAPRLLRRWGTEADSIYEAIALQIMVKSRTRPPPLPPPRRGPKPTITVFW